MENASHAQKVQPTQDVSQLPLVNKLATHIHHLQRTTTSAHGSTPRHNGRQETEHRARLSVNNNANQPHSESATSRTTPARNAIILKTKTASRPWTSARLNNKKEDAKLNN